MTTEQSGEVSLRERLKSPPAQRLVESYYVPGVASGIRHTFGHEMQVHLAHALMLAEAGIVRREAAAAIVAVLLRLRESGPSVLTIDYRQEDLYSYVERYIVEALGPDIGGRLHTGRSRNDLHTTSWRMALRERLLGLLDAILLLRTTTLRLARTHADTVMPGYTHTQHAQPITFGYWLLAAADGLARDFRRLRAALACADRCPLGSGALSTTAFPIDRAMTRDLLGFPDLVEVAYEGVASRDDLHEASAAVAIAMTGLSRLATDLQTWNTMEYGFVEFDDAYASVSSIMPQKKNPVAMEHLKAVAGLATGTLGTALACTKNTAFADVNDGVSAGNAFCLDAFERCRLAIVVFDGALGTLTVRPEEMLRAAAVGYGTATELADVLVRHADVSFRMAHNVVGRVVREALEARRPADAITSGDIDAAAEALFGRRFALPEAVVRQALDPAENVRSRTVTGGPAPERMAEMLDMRDAALAGDACDVASVRDRLAAAEQRLDALSRALAAEGRGADGPR